MNIIKVIIAENERVALNGLKYSLGFPEQDTELRGLPELKGNHFEVCSSVEETTHLPELIKIHNPKLLVIDCDMPGELGNGIGAIKIIHDFQLPIKSVMYSSYCSRVDVLQAMENGASGFFIKTSEFSIIMKALVRLSRKDEAPFLFDPRMLTDSEFMILHLMANNTQIRNPEIGKALDILPSTVGEYIRNLKKLFRINSHKDSRRDLINASLERFPEILTQTR